MRAAQFVYVKEMLFIPSSLFLISDVNYISFIGEGAKILNLYKKIYFWPTSKNCFK
jgi:hypothetical protein